jgi:hypothetical protein
MCRRWHPHGLFFLQFLPSEESVFATTEKKKLFLFSGFWRMQ